MMMNEGPLVRTLRIVVGIAVLSLTVVGPRSLLGLIGVVPLLTGVIGFCPAYRLLGIRTCPMPKAQLRT
jgi:hypothetical protein